MKKHIVFSFLLLFVHSQNQAQGNNGIIIEGKVKTNYGADAAYTSLRIAHSHNKKGTWCDGNGNFHLEGISLGDTVLFTSIVLKPSYLVVQKIYRHLEIIIESDTLNLSEYSYTDSRGELRNHFSMVGSGVIKGNRAKNVSFKESNKEISQESLYKSDENQIFRRMEISPEVYIQPAEMIDSIKARLKILQVKYSEIQPFEISLLFTATEMQVSAVTVTGKCDDKTRQAFIDVFSGISKIHGALLNGRIIPVLCKASFQIDPADQNNISIKLINP